MRINNLAFVRAHRAKVSERCLIIIKKIVQSKIGNAHIRWAFSEVAILFIRGNDQAKKYHDKLTKKFGKGKTLSMLQWEAASNYKGYWA